MSAAVAGCHGSSAAPEYPRDRKLRLNDVQVRGTHNSYHPPLPPLERQLDDGMRQLELDVFGDPSGRFFVHHTKLDILTSCADVEQCLALVRQWIDTRRWAGPLFLLIEDKDPPSPEAAARMDALDVAVRLALPGRMLITPDEVLPLAARGWPTLAAARGRVLAVLIGDMADAYARGGTSLRGRAMFVYASSGPLAAVTSRPDARTAGDEIGAFVRSGLIVRTQADEGPPDEARRSAAVASGAQIVSTQDEHMVLPVGTPSRCNPVLVLPQCTPADIEHVPRSVKARPGG